MSADTLSQREIIESARKRVQAWLADRQAVPNMPQTDAELAGVFMNAIKGTGFEHHVVNVGDRENRQFEARWTHKGATFVGFTQPPPAPDEEGAVLLGCDALLRNEWCHGKILDYLGEKAPE